MTERLMNAIQAGEISEQLMKKVEAGKLILPVNDLLLLLYLNGASDEDLNTVSDIFTKLEKQLRLERIEKAWNAPLPNEWVN